MTSYKCSKCDYSRDVKGYTVQHIKKNKACKGAEMIEHIVKVCCEVCDKEFDNNRLLGIHKTNCIEKKALVQAQYADPKIFYEKHEKLTKLMASIVEQDNILKDQVKELIKRIEKLEDKKDTGKTEDISNNDLPCKYVKLIRFVPVSYRQVCSMLKEYNMEDEVELEMTIAGQRSNIVNGNIENSVYIEIEDVKYCYDKDIAKRDKQKWAGDLKIRIGKCCEESALHRTDNGDFCDEHVH